MTDQILLSTTSKNMAEVAITHLINLPFSTTSTIEIALLAVVIPFFTFAVTLLGNSIERAKEEESKTGADQKKDFDIKITDMENKVKAAKESHDERDLQQHLEDMIKSKQDFVRKIEKIQGKYNLLKFKSSVAYPGALFLAAIIFNEIAHLTIIKYAAYPATILWVMSLCLTGVGIYRICQCLLLIEEISITTVESQNKKLADAFKSALVTYEESKAGKLELKFNGISFPLKSKRNAEIEISFRVRLIQGNVLENSAVWFNIPDDFVLIDPTEFWRQGPDYLVPNIRTIKVKLGDISTGPYTPRSIKIKTPNQIGEYIIMYTLYARGYKSERQEIKIIVAD